MHAHPRQKAAHSNRIKKPPRPRREIGGKACKEPGEEHVVSCGMPHHFASVSPEAGSEVQERPDDRHVGLATVRGDDQRARMEPEVPRAENVHAEGGTCLRPHSESDSVVERTHLGSMARMARLAHGDTAPPFELPGIDGTLHGLADFEAQPVAVIFSCVHCPYVVAWEDRINDIAREYSDRAGLVAINSNAGYLGDSIEDMRQRSDEKGFVFPFLYDETQEVASAYGAVRTPEVFLFDADHRLAYHGTPDSDHRDPENADPYLRRALDAVLDGGQPEPAEVPAVGCTIKRR
jgi:peroxiredoxin